MEFYDVPEIGTLIGKFVQIHMRFPFQQVFTEIADFEKANAIPDSITLASNGDNINDDSNKKRIVLLFYPVKSIVDHEQMVRMPFDRVQAIWSDSIIFRVRTACSEGYINLFDFQDKKQLN